MIVRLATHRLIQRERANGTILLISAIACATFVAWNPVDIIFAIIESKVTSPEKSSLQKEYRRITLLL